MDEKHLSDGGGRKVFYVPQRIAMAATVALLLSVGTFFRLHRETTVVPPGENMTVEFPDGSLAELNENSTLYFHPLWWPVSRKVYQDGEAFFKVKKGKSFEVITSLGTTEVLGTTFTVYARENRFSVTCHTGQVRVMDASSKHAVTLSMNERAEAKTSGELEVRSVSVERFVPAWKSNILLFTSTPLRQVFDKIEEHYDVRIEAPANLNLIYTGNFHLDQSAEKIISLVCRPFNLTYEKRSESEYRIIPSSGD